MAPLAEQAQETNPGLYSITRFSHPKILSSLAAFLSEATSALCDHFLRYLRCGLCQTVKGKDYGVRPFVVQLSTAHALMPGIRSQMIPERAEAGPVGHSITWFDHIKLAPWACLSPLTKPKNPQAAFQAAIWRASIGGLAIGASAVPSVAVSAYILGPNTGEAMPIIDFRTQQIPILHALAQSFVWQT
ncbi:hypothetical protein B0H14DRAFT_3731086 [Mycena olivaceomarginata]|nr:hypothetical protein B0H14DRAFT_3731086 [Mycena olivaceomarginata]